MAAFFNGYFAPDTRGSPVGCPTRRWGIDIAELAARVRGAIAEIVVLAWVTLTLAFSVSSPRDFCPHK